MSEIELRAFLAIYYRLVFSVDHNDDQIFVVRSISFLHRNWGEIFEWNSH